MENVKKLQKVLAQCIKLIVVLIVRVYGHERDCKTVYMFIIISL